MPHPLLKFCCFSSIAVEGRCGAEDEVVAVNEVAGAEISILFQAPCRAFQIGDQAAGAFRKVISQGMANVIDQSFRLPPYFFVVESFISAFSCSPFLPRNTTQFTAAPVFPIR